MTVEEFFIKYKIVCGMFNCNKCPLNEKFNTIDNMCIKTNALYPDGFTFEKRRSIIKMLIEIDDYTHQRADRIERDKFVDSVCKQANIPILHLYDVIGLEEKIVNILHSDRIEQEM